MKVGVLCVNIKHMTMLKTLFVSILTDVIFIFAAVTCPKLPTFVNGTFSPVLDVYKFQDVVQYSCLKGYTLNGSKSISCSEKEKFEPSPPTCVSKCFCNLSQRFPTGVGNL